MGAKPPDRHKKYLLIKCALIRGVSYTSESMYTGRVNMYTSMNYHRMRKHIEAGARISVRRGRRRDITASSVSASGGACVRRLH